MEKKPILLINDMAGYGKVATAAMLPILSYFGHSTCNLPTALVSNTLDYGRFAILDTTDYIRSVFPVWKELGFEFDAVATGFMASPKQAAVVAQWCSEQAQNGTQIFVDPIMADCGRLYNGVTQEAVEGMRKMLTVAHLCYPNYTEACFLTNTPYYNNGVDEPEAHQLVDRLLDLGAQSALVTSIRVDGQPAVVGYNAQTDSRFLLPYSEIPVHFPGTGDIFSAVLIAKILADEPLEQSTRAAMDAVYRLIDHNKDNADKNCGIPLEQCLNLL